MKAKQVKEKAMRWQTMWAMLLACGLMVLFQQGVYGQEEEPVNRRKFDKPQEKPSEVKLVPAGSVTGRISKVGEDGRTLTLTVTLRVQEPNPGANPLTRALISAWWNAIRKLITSWRRM
jgi:hypothetical protein